jgi:2-polyprenyl-3-methyl-5-hydroxy-6-metoxy-1,4-benzoquinol methylase
MLLPYCQSIVGVDFSEKLIAQANKIGSNKMVFYAADAKEFGLNQSFDKVVLYFSFQYFEDYESGKKVLTNLLKHAAPGALILIGDICDKRKIWRYYNSPKKWWNWLKQSIKQKNDMGKFWHPKELLQMCAELGVKAKVLEQAAWQPYAHYRFDFLIVK